MSQDRNWITVAAVGEIIDGSARCVSVGSEEVALFFRNGEYFAIGNECPHHGAALCDGFVREKTVMCPWHGWQFKLESGQCLSAPGYDVDSFEVKVEDGQVKILA